jgi:sugar phosphate isomerase/epimerase
MLSNKLAIGSLSLGQHVLHMLDDKIRVAAKHGFRGIEVVHADLERYAKSRGLSMLAGAEEKLEILSLAPLENFEGHPSPLADRLAAAQVWLDIARALGAPYMQVPAAYAVACRRNEAVIVAELRALADLSTAAGRAPAVAVAYEPMSWSVYVDTWQATLRIIRAVDRDNFGLCLDSFHILTKLWGSSPRQAVLRPAVGRREVRPSLLRVASVVYGG